MKNWIQHIVAVSCLTVTCMATAQTTALANADEKTVGEPKGDLYTLGTCPISGAALGSRGDPIVKQYDGREVRFCCKGCIGRFEADKEAGFKKIDAQLVKQQMHYYPFDTCMMTDEPLVEDGEDIAVNFIYKNRLVRTCCKACMRKFKKDPAAYLKKIDAAIVKKQRKHYPLETCVVGKGPLGAMGEPVEVIAGNRLVRFCCAGCKPEFEKNPAKYVAMIDAAWKAKHAEASGSDYQKKGQDADG